MNRYLAKGSGDWKTCPSGRVLCVIARPDPQDLTLKNVTPKNDPQELSIPGSPP